MVLAWCVSLFQVWKTMVMAGGRLGTGNFASAVTVFKMRHDFTSFYGP